MAVKQMTCDTLYQTHCWTQPQMEHLRSMQQWSITPPAGEPGFGWQITLKA